MDKKISIITCIQNQEQLELLPKFVQNIFLQTYKNIELVVVLESSKEEFEKVTTQYASESRIQIIWYENHEVPAKVQGLKNAQGEYVSFVDVENAINQDYSRLVVEKFETTDANMVLSNVVFCFNNEKYIYPQCLFDFDQYTKKEILYNFFKKENNDIQYHLTQNKALTKELAQKVVENYAKIQENIAIDENDVNTIISTIAYYFATNIVVSKNSYLLCHKKEGQNLKAGVLCLENLAKNTNESELLDDIVIWKKQVKTLDEKQLSKISSLELKKVPFNDIYDDIKKRIVDPSKKVISFDIFDTLLIRPFFAPSDLFYILDKEYAKLVKKENGTLDIQNSTLLFSDIRKQAEQIAFKELEYINKDGKDQKAKHLAKLSKESQELLKTRNEEISLDIVYKYIENVFGISQEICDQLKEKEKQLEIKYIYQRQCGKEIFDLAHYLGKTVIIVSDMYLQEDTITKMLEKNGMFEGQNYHKLYLSSKEDARKTSGKLFKKAIKELNVQPNEVIHIGDNYYADYLNAQNLGMDPIHIPNAKDLFLDENLLDVSEFKTHYNSGLFSNKDAMNEFAFRSILGLVIQDFFANPFVSIDRANKASYSVELFGKLFVGMYAFGLSSWIDSLVQKNSYAKIAFTQDAHLLEKAYAQYVGNLDNILEIFADEKSLKILELDSKKKVYSLPAKIRLTNYNAIELIQRYLMQFTEIKDEKEIAKILEEQYQQGNIQNPHKIVENDYEYKRIIDVYYAKIYSQKEHEKVVKNALENVYTTKPLDNAKTIQITTNTFIQPNILINKVVGDMDIATISLDHKAKYYALENDIKLYSLLKQAPLYANMLFRLLNENVWKNDMLTYENKCMLEQIQTLATNVVKRALQVYGDDLDMFDSNYIYYTIPLFNTLSSIEQKDFEIFKTIYYAKEYNMQNQKEYNDNQYIYEDNKELLPLVDLVIQENIAKIQIAKNKMVNISKDQLNKLVLNNKNKFQKGMYYLFFEPRVLKEKVKDKLRPVKRKLVSIKNKLKNR